MPGTSSKGIAPHKMRYLARYFSFLCKEVAFLLSYHESIIKTFDKVQFLILIEYFARNFYAIFLTFTDICD